MGDIADDMIDGTCCSKCGAYFEGDKPGECGTHGYPVACDGCWNGDADADGLQRATYKRL